MHSLLLASFLLAGLAAATKLETPTQFLNYRDPENAREQYEEFKRTYGKNYVNEDDEQRFTIFKNNLMRIELSRATEDGTATYGVNEFADLSAEEFAKIYANAHIDMAEKEKNTLVDIDMTDLPESSDWRTEGAVTPVENQGMCGSCWAFSVIGNIEGQWFRKTKELVSFSKQQLVDCDTEDDGCDGGLPLLAYSAIRTMGGLETEAEYPYKGHRQTCQLESDNFVAYVNDSVQLPVDEVKQAAWLAQHGPLSIALNANTLQFYRGGVTHPWKIFCSASGLNHAVLSVGYGKEKKVPYWIVKNSWGERWGEKGYFRIYRGDGTCGVDRYVTSAIIS